MADNAAEEFVYVRGSGDSTSPPGRVTRAAYDQIWKGKGFSIVDTDEAELALAPETQAEMAGEESTTAKSRKG